MSGFTELDMTREHKESIYSINNYHMGKNNESIVQEEGELLSEYDAAEKLLMY